MEAGINLQWWVMPCCDRLMCHLGNEEQKEEKEEEEAEWRRKGKYAHQTTRLGQPSDHLYKEWSRQAGHMHSRERKSVCN